MTELVLNRRQYLELENLADGVFAPLAGFMNEDEFKSVNDGLRLPGGAPFPLPVVLDLSAEQGAAVSPGARLTLLYEGQDVGELRADSLYSCDKMVEAKKIFGTDDANHPGVAHFLRMGRMFVGGPVRLTRRVRFEFSEYALTPADTRGHFKQRGWRTIVGFQTRNVPHRAHEYLQRQALERAEGLFIQPLVGIKRRGDYRPTAILSAYRTFIDRFLPTDRVLLGVLSTAMRYAGPREAVFHAIIRRNYGCTHFVVGRDHAGVGNYYGAYEAHELTRRFEGELGIEVLRCAGPFHCTLCGGIVTERTCPHLETQPGVTRQISGSQARALLSNGQRSVPDWFMRPEVLASVAGQSLFIEEDVE